MRYYTLSLVLILVAALLAGCGAGAASMAAEAAESTIAVAAPAGDTEGGALPDSTRLALGTLGLEGTANAVTPDQAGALLPLWQALQSGGLRNEAETAAVLKQIQGAMSAEQLAAMDAMQLSVEDLGTWMQERGANFAPPSDTAAGSGSFAPPNGLSEDERAAMHATAEAGGEMPGGGGAFGAPGDLSEKERAAMRATAEAGGMTAGGGQLAMMAQQVIEMLTARAAE